MRDSNTVIAGITVVVFLLAALVFSFFAATWLFMLIGGALGHFFHNPYMMSLGFWKYSPFWFLILLIKLL